MKLALDYDKTYNLDHDFWDEFVGLAKDYGHEVIVVTARHKELDNIDDRVYPGIRVIYCDGVAKRFVTHYQNDVDIDVWIDDKPENINNNGTATKEILDIWRQSEEYSK